MSTRNRIVLAVTAVLLVTLCVMGNRRENRRYEDLQNQMAAQKAETEALRKKHDKDCDALEEAELANLNTLAQAADGALNELNGMHQAAEAELRKANEAQERRLDALTKDNEALTKEVSQLTAAKKAGNVAETPAPHDLTEIWKNAEGVVLVTLYATYQYPIQYFKIENFNLVPDGDPEIWERDGVIGYLTAFVLEKQEDGSDGDYQYLASAGHLKDDDVPPRTITGAFREDLNLPPEKLELVGYDRVRDLSLLRFRKGFKFPGKAFKLGDSDALMPGDKVTSLGCPLDAKYTITEGNIMDVAHVGRTQGFHQPRIQIHNAQITFGNSGGPLILERTGEVVGINVMLEGVPGGYFLSTPSNDLKAMYGRLRAAKGTEVRHSQLEYAAFENSWRMDSEYWKEIGAEPVADRCVVCTEVKKGSFADTAGLKAGDIVLTVNGVVPKDDGDLWRIISDLPPSPMVPSSRCELKVKRGNDTLTLKIMLTFFKNDEEIFVHKRFTQKRIK